MFYLFHCVDKPGHAEVRARNRNDHLAYVKRFADRILVAGPTVAFDGETVTGSVLIVDFEDREAAEAFSRNDPYRAAGLFESVAILPFRKVFPAE